jgi:hypothetical protein
MMSCTVAKVRPVVMRIGDGIKAMHGGDRLRPQGAGGVAWSLRIFPPFRSLSQPYRTAALAATNLKTANAPA